MFPSMFERAVGDAEVIAENSCSNCDEVSGRLIEPAYFLIPEIDMDERCEGDEIVWTEEKRDQRGRLTSGSLITLKVVKVGEGLALRVFDSQDDPVCVKCYTHAVWPSLYQFIQGKPEQIKLDGWQDPEWIES